MCSVSANSLMHWFRLTVVASVLLFFGLGPLPGAAQTTAPSAFERGQTLFDRGLYAAAAHELDAFRHAHPRHSAAPEALYLEIRAMQALERTDEAFRLTEVLQRRYPTHPKAGTLLLAISEEALVRGDAATARSYLERLRTSADPDVAVPATLMLAQQAHRDGEMRTALQHYVEIVQSHPERDEAPEAAFRAGQLYLQGDRTDSAVRAFQAVINRYPNSPFADQAREPLAHAYAQLEQHEDVIAVLEAAPQRTARANTLLGYAYLHTEQWNSAARAFGDAERQDGASPIVTYGQAWALHHQGDHVRAAEQFTRVAESRHDLAQTARFEAARNYQLAGRPDAAREAYAAYIDRNPSDERADQALFEVGRLHYQQGNYDDAGATMERLLRSYAGSAQRGQAHLVLGNVALQREDMGQALESFDRASELGAAPDSIRDAVEFQQAWSLYESRQYRDAADAFMRVHESGRLDQREEALFWAGESLFLAGAHGDARARLQRYVQNNPRGASAPAARYTIAWSYFKQERYPDAARAFERFLDAYDEDTRIPYRADAQLRLGDSYFAQRRYDDAIDAYASVNETGRDYALFQIGEAHALRERFAEAVSAFDELVDTFPESRWHPEGLFRRGRVHFEMQNYDAALASFNTFLQTYPDHPRVPRIQYGIGDAHFNMGNFDDAIAAYRVVLEEHPESGVFADAASSIQFAFVVQDDMEGASDLIDEIASRIDDPARSDALRFRVAEATYQSGDIEAAMRQLRQFVRVADTETYLPEAYFLLGRGHAEQQQSAEARTFFEQLVSGYADHPRVPEAALRLGELYEQDGSYSQALEAYMRAGDHPEAPTDVVARARYGEAMALLQQGRAEEAEQLLRQIVRAQDSDRLVASARLGLARIAEEDGSLQEAQRLYRQVAEADEGESGAEARYRLGRLLRQAGEANQAITELERIPALYSGFPDWIARSYIEQGRAYEQLGQRGEAQRLYDRVIDRYRGTPFADEARQARDAL
ncbi:MAG: tetratricopeptide repeat protein [Longimonas sp.]|uniref:tetratricopeptide repeat protein n=1 Tax=Longimonas sp. TaxID=2039626 RepID=UPI003351F574